MSTSTHSERILDQFTRQAVPFATAAVIRDEAALQSLVQFSGAGPADTVLDVACGPGLVVCAFAKVVGHATGIDLTPAMLERARLYAAELARSFPDPGDADCIRALFAESLADDALDMQVRRDGDRIVFGGYPVAVLAARRG